MIGQMQSIINSASLHTPSCNSININSGLNYPKFWTGYSTVLCTTIYGTSSINHATYVIFLRNLEITGIDFPTKLLTSKKLIWKLDFMET